MRYGTGQARSDRTLLESHSSVNNGLAAKQRLEPPQALYRPVLCAVVPISFTNNNSLSHGRRGKAKMDR
jgi:hypothetical protein